LVNVLGATRTTFSSVIDLSYEHEVALEVPVGEQHDYRFICSTDSMSPASVTIMVRDHAVCTLSWIQKDSVTATVHCSVYLVGEQAQFTSTMRLVTTDKNRVDITLLIEHQAPETKSREDIKGVAYDASVLNFEGRVLLTHDAHYAQATMHHKQVVVGRQARVHSCPQLEALHHTVRCGHGSAISYIDDEQLFYLSSRGLDETVARALIVDSFLS
jgi:Fe-S cluster assembly scaffold protein SufB